MIQGLSHQQETCRSPEPDSLRAAMTKNVFLVFLTDLKRGASRLLVCFVVLVFACTCFASTNAVAVREFGKPMSLAEALNLAFTQSPAAQRMQKDLEAARGVVVQTRAVVLPKVQILGDYSAREPAAVDRPPAVIPGFTFGSDQSWSSQIRLVQSIYEGGRLVSSARSARLIQDQALLNHQTGLANLALDVELAYYDVLLAEQQIVVREASLELLNRELSDTQRRFAAGVVPRFNVLRAEVEVANARPPLIRARNALRIARNNLANLTGLVVPREAPDELPLVLTDRLNAQPMDITLSRALDLAVVQRSELAVLRKAESLRNEQLKSARAGYKPSLQAFGGYEASSSIFSRDLTEEVHGWLAGVQLTWSLFDGLETQGKVREALALKERSGIEITETTRQVELEVRTAYSRFVEAREVLDSQEKVLEQAEEALRLAQARSEAGTGTQLDVLGAQTALTEARTTQVQALHDYAAARARFQRALGGILPKPVVQ